MKTTKIALVAAAGIGFACLPAAVMADDDDGDVHRKGNYVVKKGRDIDGNLTVRGGTVVIHGSVDGNVRQIGKGSVIVSRSGSVDGNITESGRGNVTIRGDVDGNVTERHRGHLRVHRTADVDGNLYERGRGNLVVWRGADVDGDRSESGPGRYIRR